MYYRITDLYHDETNDLNCVEVEFWYSQAEFDAGKPPVLVEDFYNAYEDRQKFSWWFQLALRRYIEQHAENLAGSEAKPVDRRDKERVPSRGQQAGRGMKREAKNRALVGMTGDIDSLVHPDDEPDWWVVRTMGLWPPVSVPLP